MNTCNREKKIAVKWSTKHKTHQKHVNNIKEAEAAAEVGAAKDISDSITVIKINSP